jgi:hypothetical protein
MSHCVLLPSNSAAPADLPTSLLPQVMAMVQAGITPPNVRVSQQCRLAEVVTHTPLLGFLRERFPLQGGRSLVAGYATVVVADMSTVADIPHECWPDDWLAGSRGRACWPCKTRLQTQLCGELSCMFDTGVGVGVMVQTRTVRT